MDGWMDGWIDGWMDGQMDGLTLTHPYHERSHIANLVRFHPVVWDGAVHNIPIVFLKKRGDKNVIVVDIRFENENSDSKKVKTQLKMVQSKVKMYMAYLHTIARKHAQIQKNLTNKKNVAGIADTSSENRNSKKAVTLSEMIRSKIPNHRHIFKP